MGETIIFPRSLKIAIEKSYTCSHKTTSEKKSTSIDYLTEPICYDEFFSRYLICHKPCLLADWSTANWPSKKLWVCNGSPNYKHLTKEYGNFQVPVVNCTRNVSYDTQTRDSWKAEKFFQYLENLKSTMNETFYLKDWHFERSFPEHEVYLTLPYFSSDWLNESCDNENMDDYRFVYMGPKGSWTPFHEDVLKSHSWSANVCGKKKWILFPPGAENELKNKQGNLPHDIGDIKTNKSIITDPIVVEQNAGETIFVPSGWHHQVFNMEDTISINHNWINGSNFNGLWNFLSGELNNVKNEISDCKEIMSQEEFSLQCQVILLANIGMNYKKFLDLCSFITKSRIEKLQAHKPFKATEQNNNIDFITKTIVTSPEIFLSNILNNEEVTNVDETLNHNIFDILTILQVLIKFYKNTDAVEAGLSSEAYNLITKIIHLFSIFIKKISFDAK